MFLKIIFVLATVCFINASVISENVFDDDISDNTLSDLEDLVSLKEDDPDTEVASNPNGCNYRECHQRCRRLQFPGGACVNGRCKCDNFLNADDAVSESNVEDSVPSRACNNQKCNQLCRKKKFRGGACLGANCYCNKFLSLLEDQTERGCNMQACDQLCRRLKFSGGACVNGRCKCDKFVGTEVAVDEYSEFAPRRVCRLTKCNRTCTRRGYEDGTCVNGRCKCYNKTQGKEDKTERGCNMQACEQLCRRLKYPGGACVDGRCKCDNFFGTEGAVDEYSELASRRLCDLRRCNRTCIRRGYEGATCVNGRCKCYNKIQRQDTRTSPLNDVPGDENEESNVILTTNGEELIVPVSRACNTADCNQMCRRLNYAGGWCRFGKCQCY